jgi:hypothetical protein
VEWRKSKRKRRKVRKYLAKAKRKRKVSFLKSLAQNKGTSMPKAKEQIFFEKMIDVVTDVIEGIFKK